MSTRGYFGIKKKGELKGAYNHWDSYPTGLGADLIRTINKINRDDRINVLSDTFDYIKMINGGRKPTEKEQDDCLKANIVDLKVGNRSIDDWYCLLRKAQGRLDMYINKVIPYMVNDNDFLNDSLFCEWAYIINLDTNKFEVYTEGKTKQADLDLLNLDENDMIDVENEVYNND